MNKPLLTRAELFDWCESNAPESIRGSALYNFVTKFIDHVTSRPNHKLALENLLENSAVITPPAYDDVFVHLEVRTVDYDAAYEALKPIAQTEERPIGAPRWEGSDGW